MGSERRVLWGAALAVLLAGWVLLQWRLATVVVPGNADDANTVLAGVDLWRRHPLLGSWTLPADSFYTGDVALGGLLGAVFGSGPWLLRAVPLALASATLVAALWLAARDARTRWLAVLPVATVVGLPGVLASIFWLQSPTHVSTVLYCLVGFGLVGSVRSPARWWAGGALLVLAGVGDATAYAIGAAPVAAVGFRLLLVPDRRRESWRWLGVGLGSAAASAGVLALRPLVGAFRSAPPVPVVAPRHWLANAGHGVARLFQLTGALSGVPGVAGTIEHVVRVGGTVVVLGGTVAGVAALARGKEESRRRDLLCLLGLSGVASFAVFCLLSAPGAPQATTRYLLPLMIAGATAAGVVAGRARLEMRLSVRLVGSAVGALAAGAAYLAMPLRTAVGPGPAWPGVSAVRWLAANHLGYGVGTYWDASYLTLESGGAVVVRPVAAARGRLAPYHYFADNGWFKDPRFRRPAFLVFETGAPWGGVNAASAAASFGAPSRSVVLGPYTVLVWSGRSAGGPR